MLKMGAAVGFRTSTRRILRLKLLCIALFVCLSIIIYYNYVWWKPPSIYVKPEPEIEINFVISASETGAGPTLNIGPTDASENNANSFGVSPGNLIEKLDFLKISPRTKVSVDFLLNLRKLTLFAAHELNRFVNASEANTCVPNCPKWWANPLKTVELNTTLQAANPATFEHQITFLGEPGPVPFSVKIYQTLWSSRNFSDTAAAQEFTELKIVGYFTRLDRLGSAALPPNVIPQNFNSYNLNDNMNDPELFSWKRHQSFMIGDYVDFRSPMDQLYKISPGEKEKGLTEDTYCGSALKMLVMVSSAPDHFENRKVIRSTFGSEQNLQSKQVRLVFLFGKAADNTLQTKLEEEAAEYDDMIQGDFMDSYHNLSLSHLLMYNWVQRTCEQVGLPKYVLKVDDDFFLNIDLAVRVAYANPQYELIGTLYCGTPPIRQVAYMTKYYTPKYMYAPDLYVGYLSGVAYILRTDIIPAILKISLTTPMIHMDDVYVAGILPRQLNVWPISSKLFTYERTEPDPCALKKVVASSAIDVEDIRAQWNEWVKPTPSNCTFENVEERLLIEPLTEYDMVGCIFK